MTDETRTKLTKAYQELQRALAIAHSALRSATPEPAR